MQRNLFHGHHKISLPSPDKLLTALPTTSWPIRNPFFFAQHHVTSKTNPETRMEITLSPVRDPAQLGGLHETSVPKVSLRDNQYVL